MKQVILVELDALLDTRRGVLFGLDPEAGKGTLCPEYVERFSDDMTVYQKTVTQEQYLEAYKNRSVSDLKRSIVTAIHFFLGELVRQLEANHRYNHNTAETIEVFVNCHPYALTEEEKEAIAIAVGVRAGVITPVRCVDIPPENLDLAAIEQAGYTALIIYNLQEWAAAALSDLENRPANAPGVTLFAPALFRPEDALPTEEQLKDEKGNHVDPFMMLSSFLAEVIGLSFLPVKMFCTPLPEEIHNERQ